MTVLRRFFSAKWAVTTILVLAGTAVCIRLGIWQLDRLEQRRAFNAQVESMRMMEPLNLNQELPEDITSMEWRAVTVIGQYDLENQVVIRNQYHGDEVGYHLLTPLHFDLGTVLIDRGWIPAETNISPEGWRRYDETGPVTVTGQIRLGQGKPAFGGVADPLSQDNSPLLVWNNLDLETMSLQFPYPILQVFIQPDVEDGDETPPIPFQPTVELTEGSHFGYAVQWFTFATILFVGYPYYLRKQDD